MIAKIAESHLTVRDKMPCKEQFRLRARVSDNFTAILLANHYNGVIMNLRISLFVAAFAGILGACQNSPMSQGATMTQEQITEKRDKVLNMADKALARLYAQNPGVRKEIEQAAGYGVFDITAINAVLLVGSRGPGVIFDNKTGKHTFMQSMRAGTGPGLGYQELYQIFVFKSKEALDPVSYTHLTLPTNREV